MAEDQTPPQENTMQLAEILSDLVSLRVCVRILSIPASSLSPSN